MSWLLKVGGVVIGALLALLGVKRKQLNKEKEKRRRVEQQVKQHEARASQRVKVKEEIQAGQEEAHERIEETRRQARSGRRDHFASGMRDPDD